MILLGTHLLIQSSDVIPKQFDPGYLEGDDPPEDSTNNVQDNEKDDSCEEFPDPLSRALPTKQSYQNIRALPRQPGQSLIFTHRILHWGSAGNPHYKVGPRIAISFVYSDASFEAPYLTNIELNEKLLPPFPLRLLLVCAQLLIYYQRFDLSTSFLRACYDYVKLHEEELNEVYRKKVYVEFVKAMKEHRDGVAGSTDDPSANNADLNTEQCNEGDSDDEDAMLEAMLDNEEEFDDDFDIVACERKRARIN